MKNKILFIGAFPPPFGGIASHLNSVLPLLTDKGYKISVFSPGNVNSTKLIGNISIMYIKYTWIYISHMFSVIFNAIKYWHLKLDLNLLLFMKSIALAVFYSKHINEKKIDQVFIYQISNTYFIPIINEMLLKPTPIHIMIFGAFNLKPKYYINHQNYIYSIFNNSTTILSSSKHCAKSVKNILNFDFEVGVNFVGVENYMFEELINESFNFKTKFQIKKDSFVILYFARMTKIMGLQFLIDIHNEILQINENIIILIAGAEGDLSKKALDLSINNNRIKYYSNIPFSEKQTIYDNCDLIIAPTLEKHACMGVTIKEAMACRKPIIASDSGGIPEAIIDGEEGFIVPIKNNKIPKNIFVDKIRQLYDDPILRKEMGEKGKKRALKLFTNKASAETYVNIIENNKNETSHSKSR